MRFGPCVAAGSMAVIGTGFIAAPDAAWAVEVTVITPEQMAALMEMARDIYPHDRLADRFYAVAVKGYDDAAQQAPVAGRCRAGCGRQGAGPCELCLDRLGGRSGQVLQAIESTPFFQTVGPELVTVSPQSERDLAALWL